MKKLFKKLLTIVFFGITLSSCNEPITLERADNTNLDFWITQSIDSYDEFKNYTFLSGVFKGNMY